MRRPRRLDRRRKPVRSLQVEPLEDRYVLSAFGLLPTAQLPSALSQTAALPATVPAVVAAPATPPIAGATSAALSTLASAIPAAVTPAPAVPDMVVSTVADGVAAVSSPVPATSSAAPTAAIPATPAPMPAGTNLVAPVLTNLPVVDTAAALQLGVGVNSPGGSLLGVTADVSVNLQASAAPVTNLVSGLTAEVAALAPAPVSTVLAAATPLVADLTAAPTIGLQINVDASLGGQTGGPLTLAAGAGVTTAVGPVGLDVGLAAGIGSSASPPVGGSTAPSQGDTGGLQIGLGLGVDVGGSPLVGTLVDAGPSTGTTGLGLDLGVQVGVGDGPVVGVGVGLTGGSSGGPILTVGGGGLGGNGDGGAGQGGGVTLGAGGGAGAGQGSGSSPGQGAGGSGPSVPPHKEGTQPGADGVLAPAEVAPPLPGLGPNTGLSGIVSNQPGEAGPAVLPTAPPGSAFAGQPTTLPRENLLATPVLQVATTAEQPVGAYLLGEDVQAVGVGAGGPALDAGLGSVTVQFAENDGAAALPAGQASGMVADANVGDLAGLDLALQQMLDEFTDLSQVLQGLLVRLGPWPWICLGIAATAVAGEFVRRRREQVRLLLDAAAGELSPTWLPDADHDGPPA